MIAPFPGYFSDDAEKRILFGLQASPVDSFRHNAFCENFLPQAAISEKNFGVARNDVTPNIVFSTGSNTACAIRHRMFEP